MIDNPSLFNDEPNQVHAGSAEEETLRSDEGLRRVAEWFRSQKNLEIRFGSVFRRSLDEVLDGQRTGRYDIDKLAKTEKTYLGTKVEIVTRATFGISPGKKMDYIVDGQDLDAKFSLKGQWQIPSNAMGHLCLLMAAKEHEKTFDVGLIRITEEVLNQGRNQDKKATITASAKKDIIWLCHERPLPANFLLSLPKDAAKQITKQASGQERINELFRLGQKRIIDRNTSITVAMQADSLKRCRDARTDLAREGIIVLGHQNDCPRIARALKLPVPKKGTLLSVRLVEVPVGTADREVVEIDGRFYAEANPDEAPETAPPIKY